MQRKGWLGGGGFIFEIFFWGGVKIYNIFLNVLVLFSDAHSQSKQLFACFIFLKISID